MRHWFSVALLMLNACGQQTSIANNQTSQPIADAADESENWHMPPRASEIDKSLILAWFKANDGCQGGINVTMDDPICKMRDAQQDRLRERGWCWGAPLEKTAADSDWHHCGDYNTDNVSNLAADIQRGRADLKGAEDVGANVAPDPNAGDWSREKERKKSPLLQAYENAVEPIDQKIGLAKVLQKCGIRGPGWLQQMVSNLENRKYQASISEMGLRLTSNEAAEAKRFERSVIDGTIKFNLGGSSKEEACTGIANAPFAASDATFK